MVWRIAHKFRERVLSSLQTIEVFLRHAIKQGVAIIQARAATETRGHQLSSAAFEE